MFVGANGYGNLGDDGYKHVISGYLSERYDVSFNSPYPDLRMVDDCDALFIGGGGLLYDDGSAHLAYMRLYVERAQLANKPYGFISVGFQPVNEADGLTNDELVALGVKQLGQIHDILKGAQFITVRDEISLRIVQTIAPLVPSECLPDLCYAIKPAPYSLTAPGTVVFVITEMTTTDGIAHKIDVQLFEKLWTKAYDHGNDRCIVVMSKDDEAISEEFAKTITQCGGLVLKKNLTPMEAAAIFRDADYVVTGRYHGKVFARAAGLSDDRIFSVDKRFKSRVEKVGQRVSDVDRHFVIMKQRLLNKI